MNNIAEYKGNCFDCDVGCSVSRSGYSPMNYVPYNNLIRRREETPVNNGKKNKNKNKGTNNIMVHKPGISNENNNKKYIKYSKPKIKKSNKKKKENMNDRYNEILTEENQNLRDKRNKGLFTYSEVDSEEVKKLQFLNNSAEYKGNCFACDVGCSVSRSGYSPMTYSPYGKKEKRRDLTPLNKLISE